MIRILLLDDHPVLRHGVRTLLDTQADFAVVAEAGSADEAVELAIGQRIDVALVDLDLGDGAPDRIAATQRILRESPRTPRACVFGL